MNSNICPELIYYTIEEQRELERSLKTIEKFIIDYGDLREQLKSIDKD